jgi:excisionase family DNA binding protein
MFDESFVVALRADCGTDQSEISNWSLKGPARLLTVKEAAAYIGRSEQAIQHLIHKRELIVVRTGRRVHIDRGDLDRWIEANKI